MKQYIMTITIKIALWLLQDLPFRTKSKYIVLFITI